MVARALSNLFIDPDEPQITSTFGINWKFSVSQNAPNHRHLLYDLNLASGVCDDVLLLKGGRSLSFGTPNKVLSEETVSDAFTSLRDKSVFRQVIPIT